jgi:hypothetical protein
LAKDSRCRGSLAITSPGHQCLARVFGQGTQFNDTAIETVEASPVPQENFPKTKSSTQTDCILPFGKQLDKYFGEKFLNQILSLSERKLASIIHIISNHIFLSHAFSNLSGRIQSLNKDPEFDGPRVLRKP